MKHRRPTAMDELRGILDHALTVLGQALEYAQAHGLDGAAKVIDRARHEIWIAGSAPRSVMKRMGHKS